MSSLGRGLIGRGWQCSHRLHIKRRLARGRSRIVSGYASGLPDPRTAAVKRGLIVKRNDAGIQGASVAKRFGSELTDCSMRKRTARCDLRRIRLCLEQNR